MGIYFNCDKDLKQRFENVVGRGNISKSLVDYMEQITNISSEDIDINQLYEKLKLETKEAEIHNGRVLDTRSKIKAIEARNRAEEYKKLQDKKEQDKKQLELGESVAASIKASGIIGSLDD